MSTADKISIVIPVFNESKAIGAVLAELLNYKFPFAIEIIVIDDGSSDDTLQVVERYQNDHRITIIRHTFNRGYGGALKTGIRVATGNWVVTYDGDGQFDPEDIEKFWREATVHLLDVVIGERSSLGAISNIVRTPGKFFIRFLINRLIDVKITDFNCGLRLMKRDVILKYLHLCSDKFSFSTTSTLILISRGYHFKFSGANIRSRMNGVSKVRISAGLSTINLVVKMIMLTNPLRIFIPIGIILLVIGLIIGVYYFSVGGGLSVGSLFLLISGILLVFLGLIADQIAELRKSQFERE